MSKTLQGTQVEYSQSPQSPGNTLAVVVMMESSSGMSALVNVQNFAGARWWSTVSCLQSSRYTLVVVMTESSSGMSALVNV